MNNASKHQGALIEDIPTERFELMTKVLLVVPFMVPQKRQLSVQRIAEIALIIASDKVKGMIGQSIIIDGGYAAQ